MATKPTEMKVPKTRVARVKDKWEIDALAKYKAEVKVRRIMKGITDLKTLEKLKDAIAYRESELTTPAQ